MKIGQTVGEFEVRWRQISEDLEADYLRSLGAAGTPGERTLLWCRALWWRLRAALGFLVLIPLELAEESIARGVLVGGYTAEEPFYIHDGVGPTLWDGPGKISWKSFVCEDLLELAVTALFTGLLIGPGLLFKLVLGEDSVLGNLCMFVAMLPGAYAAGVAIRCLLYLLAVLIPRTIAFVIVTTAKTALLYLVFLLFWSRR